MSTNTAAITPFWQRLREIMLYPSKPAAVVTVVMLGVLRLLALSPGPAGTLLGLVVFRGGGPVPGEQRQCIVRAGLDQRRHALDLRRAAVLLHRPLRHHR